MRCGAIEFNIGLLQIMRPYIILAVAILFVMQSTLAQDVTASPFTKAGIPSVTRNWTGTDYKQTVSVLSLGTVPLPVFSDTQGAALLRRITATENFSFYRNRTLPLQTRITDYFSLQDGVASLAKLYFARPTNSTNSSTAEIASLLSYLLRSSNLGLELVEEFLPAVSKDDKYAGRMEGLKKMKSGLTSVFVGAEQTLTEQNGFSSSDRSRILEAMAETLPTMKKAFTQDYKVELRQKLQADRAKFSDKADVLRIDSMLNELVDRPTR
jgi:hypothetical protein